MTLLEGRVGSLLPLVRLGYETSKKMYPSPPTIMVNRFTSLARKLVIEPKMDPGYSGFRYPTLIVTMRIQKEYKKDT
jgi:hypothetical protein